MPKTTKPSFPDPLRSLKGDKWNSLPTTIEKISRTENIVPRPTIHGTREVDNLVQGILIGHELRYAYISIESHLDRHGDTTLILIPSNNINKAGAIFKPFMAKLEAMKPKHRAVSLMFDDKSGIGGQPTGWKAGMTGASTRVKNVLTDEKSIVVIKKFIEAYNEGKISSGSFEKATYNTEAVQHKIRKLVVMSIENYIEPKVELGNLGQRAVDFGGAFYYDPARKNQNAYSAFSRGVTVPKSVHVSCSKFWVSQQRKDLRKSNGWRVYKLQD